MRSLRIYGDSILKGVMYNAEMKRYKLCRYNFAELEEAGVTIENNSKMGVTVDEGFEILKYTLPECTKDDVVVMEFGGNDCNYDWKAISENPDRDYECKTPEDKFVSTYTEMINYARSKGATVLVATLVPIESEKFTNWISRGLDYDRILSFLGDKNTTARWQEYYSHLSEQVAKKTGCPILDLRSNFLVSRKLDKMICEDGIHPNEQGHELIRKTFVREIKEFATA